MKVVLFCGGLGMRMRDGVSSGPKPMAMIGDRPLMWHVMRYYAHFGHTDFVLCLGYGASYVKDFFLNYDETRSNDFVLEGGDRQVKLFRTDISDWRITFVDTGLNSAIGERLRRVRRFVEDEPMFLANYADVFTDAPLPEIVETVVSSDVTAGFLSVRPSTYSFHTVDADEDGIVRDIRNISSSNVRVNAGFFVFRAAIFDAIHHGEDLVDGPFRRLIEQEQLLAVGYDGFWAPMDTLKDKALLDSLLERGEAPWLVWEPDGDGPPEQPDASTLAEGG